MTDERNDTQKVAAIAAEQEAAEQYISEYEYCGDDGYYSPTEWETELIRDALQGWLSDRTVSFARPVDPNTIAALAHPPQPDALAKGDMVIAGQLDAALSERNESRFKILAFLHRHEIIAALQSHTTTDTQADRMREALERATTLIDDLLCARIASELCSEEQVKSSGQRIADGGGTLAYIADCQQNSRTALTQKDAE